MKKVFMYDSEGFEVISCQLMEVKFDEYLPDYIYRALNLGTLQQTAFSKYYLCRRFAQKGV